MTVYVQKIYYEAAVDDIFGFIESSISTASLKRPKEFMSRRWRIAKLLYGGDDDLDYGSEIESENCCPVSKWVPAQSPLAVAIGCEHNRREVHPLSHQAVVVSPINAKSPSKPFQNRSRRPNFSKSRLDQNGKIATAGLNKMAASERNLTKQRRRESRRWMWRPKFRA
ncbi:Uncharacterized protein Fot_33013 [Forsythia ovata]|uniref:Uncharacterized protein n=1 Tax=Forsythia ovata TaxID=205694 RepID=A0ABD1T9N6_9LAMI